MRTITTDDVSRDWPSVAAEARHAPVRVSDKDGLDLVILSHEDYERIRGVIGQNLKEAMDIMGRTAEARGLTEEKLEELLADES